MDPDPKDKSEHETENSEEGHTPAGLQPSLAILNPTIVSEGTVTRVVSDLIVFAEVKLNERHVGLVFKPHKIVGYRGQPLDELGIFVGTNIPEIAWDVETLRVIEVRMSRNEITSQSLRGA
jgi:hypothetical protein